MFDCWGVQCIEFITPRLSCQCRVRISQGYQSLCIRKRCLDGILITIEVCNYHNIYSIQHSLLEIISRWISLCDKDVLNDIVILEAPKRGNKEKRIEKCT